VKLEIGEIEKTNMKESELWIHLNQLQKTKNNWHLMRIESNTINGIPDVNGCINGVDFWLELKSKEIKNCGLSKYQINWHTDRLAAGGKVFILLFAPSQKSLKILQINPKWVGDVLDPGIEELASAPFSKKNLEQLLLDVVNKQNLT
jgi:hypothetical protein|tara:strand:- start:612 stop:1052 length:441 start_codon:yes stop_codon:yes gene_type:complete